MNFYRFDYQFEKHFATDAEALTHSNTWHDDRAAVVEKWIDGRWCPHSDPIYQPQYYYGGKDGGWMDPRGKLHEVIYS